jgi:heptosyltransferase-3
LKVSSTSEIHKILVVTLSNIGDVILTFPVIDVLKKDFPEAKLSVVVGPKGEALLHGNPYLDHIHVFDKHQSWMRSWRWLNELRKERFDLVVDLRNTAIPALLAVRYRTSWRVPKAKQVHMREKHLQKLRTVYAPRHDHPERCALFISEQDEQFADRIMEEEVGKGCRFMVVAPGAADSSKRWPEERFAALCDWLIKEHTMRIIFAGSDDDRDVVGRIKKSMMQKTVDLSGRASLTQLAALLKMSAGAIVNDSAPMHLASYLNTPVLALFGPTDPLLYGPWGTKSCYLRRNGSCARCARPQQEIAHTCMNAIAVSDVMSVLDIRTLTDSIHFKRPQ